jgi:hypothetical protein
MFLCNAVYIPGSPFASHCKEDTSRLKSKLEPSDDIVYPSNIISIESGCLREACGRSTQKRATLSFASWGGVKVVGDHCLKVDWKSSIEPKGEARTEKQE